MIRINLLEEPGVYDVGLEEAPSASSFQAKVLVPSLLVAAVLLGSLYFYWNHKIGQLNEALAVQQREAARLAAIQQENRRYQSEVQEREARLQTVQMLENSRTGPVDLMQFLGASVNRTQGLYLMSVSSKNGRLGLEGGSPSVTAIANLITALGKTGTFDDVQLHQYYEDDRFDQVHYRFNLDCVYKPPVRPPAVTPAPAPQAAAASNSPKSQRPESTLTTTKATPPAGSVQAAVAVAAGAIPLARQAAAKVQASSNPSTGASATKGH